MERIAHLLFVALMARESPAPPPDTVHYQIRIGESVIGSVSSVTTEEASGSSRRWDRTLMTMAREGRKISFEEETVSLEDSSGSLFRFQVVRRGLGPSDWVDTLERIPQGWRRVRDRGGVPLVDTLADSRPLGPLGIERALAASPDSIRVVDLDPVRFSPRLVEAELLRQDHLEPSGQAPLCSVYRIREVEGDEEVLQWRDQTGTLWREEAPLLGWTLERLEIAQGEIGSIFEAMDWPRLPVSGRIPSKPPCLLTVIPTGEVSEDLSEPPFPVGPGQEIRPGETPGSWEIYVQARALPQTTEVDRQQWSDSADLAACLRPGLIIDSEASEIVRFAREAVEGADSPTEKARSLERAVHSRIGVRDLGTVFATASQTLRDRTGDCTEHAILLAACCRALGIPARLIAGIVPYGGQMQFHLWTEVFLGEWVDLDATIGEGRRSACAVGLLRWEQPEEGMQELAGRIQGLIGRYRFVAADGS